jgi:hypothetical protein
LREGFVRIFRLRREQCIAPLTVPYANDGAELNFDIFYL